MFGIFIGIQITKLRRYYKVAQILLQRCAIVTFERLTGSDDLSVVVEVI